MNAPATRRGRTQAPLKVRTTGSPADGDLRALAALLVKLDRRPPVRLVSTASPAAEPPPTTEEHHGPHSG